ncbi:hypothetical protein [Actinomyces sp. 565]|uniref:hypothetical protein n=1 Tax=Actinomyces sp. 565 TaxID=2057794 RepID=UPI001EF131CE|nr:hypothetical protein [Actinomyces sp. 565]
MGAIDAALTDADVDAGERADEGFALAPMLDPPEACIRVRRSKQRIVAGVRRR